MEYIHGLQGYDDDATLEEVIEEVITEVIRLAHIVEL